MEKPSDDELNSGERAFIHTEGWAGLVAVPCVVLSRKGEYVTVRLLADLKVNGRLYRAGTIKSRVPHWSCTKSARLSATVVEPKKGD